MRNDRRYAGRLELGLPVAVKSCLSCSFVSAPEAACEKRFSGSRASGGRGWRRGEVNWVVAWTKSEVKSASVAEMSSGWPKIVTKPYSSTDTVLQRLA